ncbi:MAG: Rpn family recombination-promoting nuclease/putative transposase, partial [Chitinophagia bacterium]|nr:Rpn family recombination-promoting nuclease/putative transposase [Chitinophagia bacterium]
MSALYVNPFTDFGFKKLFGEEASKVSLIDFLNALLSQYEKDFVTITDLKFSNPERLPEAVNFRHVVYDLICTNQNGETYIVEMQNTRQLYFKERTVFYSTFPIQQQAPKGPWNFKLNTVYCIAILNFTFPDSEDLIVRQIKLKDQNNEIF